MKIPKFLSNNATIALIAPSFGSPIDPYRARVEHAITTYEFLGHSVIASHDLYTLVKGQSANKYTRARAFMEYYMNAEVDFIHAVAGGERMLEILPYIDFKAIKHSRPKFFMGYSDNTTLTFTLTTISHVASIYGPCAHDFGMSPWDASIHDVYALMQGKRTKTMNYLTYEIEDLKKQPGGALSPYNLTEKAVIKHLKNTEKISQKGRLLGGCLDILVSLVGTPYDHVNDYIKTYKNDGIIWVLETADLHAIGTLRALWQLKEAGWFASASLFLFGRPAVQDSYFDVTFEEAVLEVLGDLNIEIITGVDVGHLAPQMGFIHGAKAHVTSDLTTLTIDYKAEGCDMHE